MNLCVRFAAIGFAALSLLTASAQDHRFSVKDDIAMVRFSNPSSDPDVLGSETAKPSPDGEYVAIVTTKGLLESDQIESDLSVFRLNEISAFFEGAGPPPERRVIASIASYPHREKATAYAPVIQDLRWSSDGRGIYFRGENGAGAYQLYLAKLDGSGFQALTPANQSVDRFDVARSTIVYKASIRGDKHGPPGNTINADALVATGSRIQDVIFPDQLSAIEPESFTLSILQHTNGRWSTTLVPDYSARDLTYLSSFFPFALSPRGTKLIALTPVLTIPDAWKRFEPVTGFEHLRLVPGLDGRLTSDENVMRPQQYTLIDLGTGKSTPLVDAPNARSLAYYLDSSRVTWAADEKRVLATNTFLTMNENDALGRKRPCAVASFDLPSLNARCLFFEGKDLNPAGLHVQDVSFGASDDDATVTLTQGPKQQVIQRYRFGEDGWRLSGASSIADPSTESADSEPRNASDKRDIQVSVRQNLNEPPTLWVSNRRTGKTRQLWDPNPQFGRMRFGEASRYRWTDKAGREWSGVLVKPVDYEAGKRYPLVVQMYSYVDGQFLTDGLYPTAFAARHLASVGFVVLQIKKKPDTLSEADPQIHLEGYRSAIESLDAAGLVDRSRVGVVGFSWTCWYAVNALIRDPKLFAAATIADGLDNSYMQYLIFGVGAYPILRQMERIRETSPFGDGLKKWMEEAPGFHLDRVQSPVRIEAINPGSVLQEWELYASLRIQNKPVDLVYFPHGTHIHQKPLERLESQQGSVDWFRFWLQGYEDPDPAKQTQYERWRVLQRTSPTVQPTGASTESGSTVKRAAQSLP
jgi:dipeptidyl aminopeptidase/acylaminoacyl peptidase